MAPDRLRVHPDKRFAGHELVFDLGKDGDKLVKEPEIGVHGHHQQTLCKHGKTSLGLYTFDKGGKIPQHKTHGVTIIHVLKGKIAIHSKGGTTNLGPNQIMLLDSDVGHDMVASAASQALMTIVLDK